MNNLKRVLSLALSGIMLVGMMAIGASAADFTDAEKIQHEDAVNTLVALNIVNGQDDGSFNPEGNVTRGQMAKMIAVALNGGVDTNTGVKGTASFTDIKGHWAESYIEYCADLGIISGRGDGTFDPDGNVTTIEAAKMVLTALGYNSDAYELTGAKWATQTDQLARMARPSLYEELPTGLVLNTNATRDTAAQVIWNGLQNSTVRIQPNEGRNDGTISWSYGPTNISLLRERFNAVATETILEEARLDTEKGEYTYQFSTWYDEDNNPYSSVPTLKTTADYSDLWKQQVKAVYKLDKNNTVLGIFAKNDAVMCEGVVGDLPDDLDPADRTMKVDGTTYTLDGNAGNTRVFYNLNGTAVKTSIAALSGIPVEYTMKLIDNDDDGAVNCIIAYPFGVAKVSYVGSDTFNVAAVEKDVMSPAGTLAGIKKADVVLYEGLKKDDFVKVIPASSAVADKVTYEKIDDDAIVEGKVEATRSSSIRIDDVWHSFDSDKTVNNYALDSTFKLIKLNGYIVGAETITNGANLSDYALVEKAVTNANTLNSYQARLIFTDGTKKDVETKYNYNGTYNSATAFSANADYAMEGALVTFKIESGKYILTPADQLTAGASGTSGFDRVIVNKDTAGSYVYAASGKSTVGGEQIDNDAVVYTYNGTKYSVITGSDLKKYSDVAGSGVSAVKNAFGNKASATSYNNVVLAYVTVAATVDVQTSNYGYVTSALTTTRNKDNETVSVLTLWTADGELKDIECDANVSDTVAKGSIVTYDAKSNGTYTVKRASNVNYGAVIAYNADNGAIRITDSTLMSTGTNVNLDIVKDTVVLGINSNSKSGVEGADVAFAVETSTANKYQANVYYVKNGANNDLDLLVVDTYGDLPKLPGKAVLPAGANAAAVTAALKENGKVESDITNLSGVVVPKGATLALTSASANLGTLPTGEGTVELAVDAATVPAVAATGASTTKAGTDSDGKLVTNAVTVTIPASVSLTGAGKATTYSNTKTLSELAAYTGSSTFKAVDFTIPVATGATNIKTTYSVDEGKTFQSPNADYGTGASAGLAYTHDGSATSETVTFYVGNKVTNVKITVTGGTAAGDYYFTIAR